MRAPALAVAWEFRQRHRWGLIALTGYLIVLAAIRLLILDRGQPVNLDSPQRFAVVVVVPLAATFTYLLAAFSFGLSGDLAARRSMYPARMFALPVTTSALAFWPMLYGTAAMSMLWLATRFFAIWPSGVAVPLIWPALAAAALLAWTQALTWMPYGLPGLRVIVAVLWLAMMDTVVLLALHYRASEPVMLAILAPQLPVAYLAARFAVARARRGDVPDWRGVLVRLGEISNSVPRRRHHFASAASAQAWFEWRRHGRSLPALVGILLPFELALLFVADGDTPALAYSTLLGVLLTPPFMAAFVAATVRKSSPHVNDSGSLTPCVATRPVTDPALVAATLKAAAWGTIAAWLLVVVAIPLALVQSGTDAMVVERAGRILEALGTPRAMVLALLALAGLLVSTWKQLVQSLYVGLTGRDWAIRTYMFLVLLLLAAIGPLAVWIIEDSGVRVALWNAIPMILGVLVCFKMSGAAWIATRLHRNRVLADRTLLVGAACWVAAVFALYGVLAWLLSMPFFPRYLVGLFAILATPLTRLSAAPLALARNRHR